MPNTESANRLRVMLYGINYAPEPIGVGLYSRELMEYLNGADIDVDVVTAVPHYPGWTIRDNYRNRYRTECIRRIRVTHCPLYLRHTMGGMARVLTLVSFALTSAPVFLWRIFTRRPDVVFCVEPTLFCAPLALLAAWLVGARTVMHVQDLEVDAAFAVGHFKSEKLKYFALQFEGKVLKAFDAVVTISYRMCNKLQDKGVKAEKISVIRNWVDTEEIKLIAGDSSLRAEYGIASDAFVVLYSGNVGLKQGLGLIPLIAERLKAHSDIVFIIAGDGPEKKVLQRQCRVLPNVIFLPLQPRDRLCDLLNMADVHFLPQKAETADLMLPSKLGGMLASGKHCIVMANADTELYNFLHGVAELLPPGDVEACASAILRLRAQAPVIDNEKRQKCLQELDSKRNLKRFGEVLVRIAGAKDNE